MAIPERVITINANNPFTDSSTDLQYREAVFNLANTFKLAGWTVTNSSNGTTASAADNWASVADVVLGTEGSGSWIVLQSPGGEFDENAFILIAIMEASSTVAKDLRIRLATLDFTGGTTTTLPTSAGAVTSNNATGAQIIPWVNGRYGSWISWFFDNGDVWFATKTNGSAGLSYFFMFNHFSSSEPGDVGSNRSQFFQFHTIDPRSTFPNFDFATHWRAIRHDGTALNSALGAFSDVEFICGNWAPRHSTNGRIAASPMHIGQTNALGYYMGRIRDIYGTHTPPGRLDPSEAGQAQRRYSIGSAFVFLNSADLPLL